MGNKGQIILFYTDKFIFKILFTACSAVIFSFISIYILFSALSYSISDVDVGFLSGLGISEIDDEISFAYDNNFSGYLHWLNDFINGNTKTIEFQTPIRVFSFGEIFKSVGLIFFKTIGFTFLCLFSGIFFSLIINLKIIFNNNVLSKIAKGIDTVLSLISGIHVIIVAIILLGLFDNESKNVPTILLAIIVIIGSNIYYDISSFHAVTLQRLIESDYILAAKAWGDSTFRHMRRTIGLMLLNQVSSSWSHILTNVIIVEIMFQKGGLGYELFKQIFSGDGVFPDISVILAISALTVLSIQCVSLVRILTQLALKFIR
jgi:ABC-type dipeptide/oligopeptide/nickel transport system permease component